MVFPSASSPPFHFDPGTGYAVTDTLRMGNGFWLKFDAPESLAVAGNVAWSDSIPVTAGWNLVGMISGPLDSAAVTSIPPGIRVSGFYRFDPSAGYLMDAMLQPGRGYWVKAGSDGLLILTNVTGIAASGAKPSFTASSGVSPFNNP
jgi:hypothetical protein